ncbi:MarC family NAAT transporter [Defluviicoccus vanus]|nr:MarC family NAAT transporter [Defluviicoccus vanus]
MQPGHFVEIVSLSLFGLLPIVNPFSVAPLFLTLTADMDERTRRQQALNACVYGFLILLTFLLLGSFIIDFFGISVSGIRVAGGLIIAFIGFRMLFPDPHPAMHTGAASDQRITDVSFTPLAMPSLAGPGSISLALSAAGRMQLQNGSPFYLTYGAVILGIALTFVIAYFTLLAASYMVRFLGRSGTDAMTRIFGFLLICIGVQFFLTGIASFFRLQVN